MELSLREKYALGIEVVFLALVLISTVVVRLLYYIAVKRKWNRCTSIYKRFILPIHYFMCLCILSAILIVANALDFVGPWVSIVGVWAVLSLGWIHYNRHTHVQNMNNLYEMESMLPQYASYEFQEQYLMARGQLYKASSRGVGEYAKRVVQGAQARKGVIVGGVVVSILASLLGWLLAHDMCIAAHPVQVSTWFSRKFQPNLCANNGICNVYFTLPEDPTTSIIVNFHSEVMPQKGFVDYRVIGESRYDKIEANWFKFEELKEVNRYIFWAEISGLEPGTPYQMVPGIQDAAGNLIYASDVYKVKTLPSAGNVTFVTGGDMQNDQNGIQMSQVAASHDPSFVLFGGDIAYANSNLHCYRRWDSWFHDWNTYMKTSLGFSIPLSLTIGNHEAGGDRGRSREDVKFYLEYFPQQTGLKDVPPKSRELYHAHQIGNHTLLLVLDSGLVEPYIGPQSLWLSEQLNATTSPNKIASYHYPLYPAVTVDTFMTPEEKQTWVDIFETYDLTVAFENHFHVFKESKPIRKNQVDEKDGIKYFGDGAWGIDGGVTFLNPNSWWIESAEQKAHVYVATASEVQFDVKAFDLENQPITSFTKTHPQPSM